MTEQSGDILGAVFVHLSEALPQLWSSEVSQSRRAPTLPLSARARPAQDVTAQSLQLLPVVAVNHLLGIETETGDFGNWLISQLTLTRLGPVR